MTDHPHTAYHDAVTEALGDQAHDSWTARDEDIECPWDGGPDIITVTESVIELYAPDDDEGYVLTWRQYTGWTYYLADDGRSLITEPDLLLYGAVPTPPPWPPPCAPSWRAARCPPPATTPRPPPDRCPRSSSAPSRTSPGPSRPQLAHYART
ncbi:hypothetical protein [Kitasatospora fiedleri]|uniref:hypothetical protein n=1 Tax=Kitasatospora fiedleri TaxID=2991545 RepID=UPI00249B2231|nr:hypothetical protein [Kitasatospora fiedleri]